MTDAPHEEDKQTSISELRFSLFNQIKEPLGALVIHFADLESSVTHAINTLMGVYGPIGQTLHSLMPNFSTRIELFHILAMMHSASHYELERSLPSIISRLKNSNAKRNHFLHDPWTIATINIDRDKNYFAKKRYKAENGKLREAQNMTEIQVKDIWDAVDEIYRLALTIYDWRLRYINRANASSSPVPLHDISQQRSPLRRQTPD